MKYANSEEQSTKHCDFGLGFQSKGELTKKIPPTLDLNIKSSHFLEETSKQPKSFNLDLNLQHVSTNFNHQPFHLYKNYNPELQSHSQSQSQSQDSLSECGSTCGPIVEKDSMRIWKQMKQNGFLSSSHCNVWVPPMPKPRGRKKGNELGIKKKIEIAKREQVNRFAKVAAPSGLLNELNPGIINHVRNRKQVHSIIENLVRSSRNKNKKNEIKECEDDALMLKLSSTSTMVSENLSSVSHDESANISTVDSLSVKAASVASQWLELIHQDIKGRLAALKHSKKRVRSVIQTELPFLISNELSSNQENDSSVVNLTNNANNEMHKIRWTALFDQMDKSLSEEEKNLENSLNQVKEMLLHCEQNATLQSNYTNLKAVDKDLAIRAAAAAIYSTSNFLQSVENLPYF